MLFNILSLINFSSLYFLFQIIRFLFFFPYFLWLLFLLLICSILFFAVPFLSVVPYFLFSLFYQFFLGFICCLFYRLCLILSAVSCFIRCFLFYPLFLVLSVVSCLSIFPCFPVVPVLSLIPRLLSNSSFYSEIPRFTLLFPLFCFIFFLFLFILPVFLSFPSLFIVLAFIYLPYFIFLFNLFWYSYSPFWCSPLYLMFILSYTLIYQRNLMSFPISSSSECSAQGQVLHCKRRNQGRSSVEDRSSSANSGIKAAVLPGINRCGSLPLLPHPALSLASEQILKNPRGTNVEVRSVDLANLAIRTSPKFTTRVKYQFHKCFWPDQRSGNPSHRSLICKKYSVIHIRRLKHIMKERKIQDSFSSFHIWS